MAECRDVAVSNLNSPNQSVVNEAKDSKEDNKNDRAMEPLLIEDLKPKLVPRSFETLQKSFSDKKVILGRDDYLVLLIHILMLEVGFIPHHCSEYYYEECYSFHYRRIVNTVTQLPSNWKCGTSCYFLTYVLPPFITYNCQLVFTLFGDDMILNCTVPNITHANYTVLLDPALYVMTSTTNIDNKFQSMKHLSRIVKDNICNPAKHSILIENDLQGLYLEGAPLEVIYMILNYLNTTDLAMIESTSKFFRKIANDRILWKHVRGSHTEKSFLHFKRAQITRHRRSETPGRLRNAYFVL